MRRFPKIAFCILVVSAAVLMTAGCSKPQSEEPSPAGKTPSAPEPAAPIKPVQKPVATPATPTPSQPQTGMHQQEARRLETAYQAASDLTAKMEVIFDLGELGSGYALEVIGRLFQLERDTELKMQLLEALEEIQGNTDAKLAILSIGAQPGQPTDVRETVVDVLQRMNETRGMWILQGLLNDPDPDVREDAQTAMEVLRAQQGLPPE